MSPPPSLHEDQRIIGRAVQFHRGHFARLRERIAHRSVHLRRAAHAVRILHARIFFRRAMRFANLAAFVQVRQVSRRRRRAGVCSRVHDSRVERSGTSAQRVERKRRRNIRGVDENIGFAQRETQQRQHSLRAVEQRKPFLRFQRDGVIPARRIASPPAEFRP